MATTSIILVYRQGDEDPHFATTTPEIAQECCDILNAEEKESGWAGAYGPFGWGALELIDSVEDLGGLI